MIIQAKGIEKSFGDLKVLKGIDFQVGKSEVVSIMGASGAGKSTLLQILGTLSTPDAGTLEQLPDIRLSLRHRRPGHQGFQEGTFIAGRSDKDAHAAAARLLADMGLSERMDHKPSELSGGEQQRVAIARALVNDPAILFADEPSGNLDTKTKDEIHKLFFDLRDNYGQTIVIVTHDPDLARMCDRSLFMRDGQFVDE